MAQTEEIIREVLTNIRPATKNNLMADCPYCGKESHFFINRSTGAHDCKKCGHAHKSLYPLLRELNKLYLLGGRQIDLKSVKSLAGHLPTPEADERKSSPLRRPPAGFKPLPFHSPHPVAAYLRSRKFTELDFEMYSPGYSDLLGKYRNYAIIPIEQDFERKGYVARILPEHDDDIVPRYKNSKGTDFGSLIWGLDEVTQATRTVLMVEGPFDKVGVTTELDLHATDQIKCLCSFGKKLTQAQILLLSQTSVENLVFLYDFRDAIDDMKKTGLRASQYFNTYATFEDTALDPAQMSANQLLKLVENCTAVEDYFYDVVQPHKVKM